MNRTDIFLNLTQRARNAADMFNALAIRFSGISLEAFSSSEAVQNEARLNETEERALQNSQDLIGFYTQSDQIGFLSLDNFYHALELNQDGDHPSEPVTPVQYVSPEPRPVSLEPLSPQRSPSYQGEPHEATPPLPEPLPRANSINLVLHPNYTRDLPEEGARIINDFVANGVNEHICMQLLQYFAMTFKNLLTTVEKYLQPNQRADIDFLTLNSEANLVRSFNPELINVVYVSANTFEKIAKTIFPTPHGQMDAEFSALYQPFKSMKKRRTYLYAHMIYLYLCANLYRNRQYDQVHLLHETMIRLLKENIRILPKIGTDWKWRIAKVNNEPNGRLHFVFNRS